MKPIATGFFFCPPDESITPCAQGPSYHVIVSYVGRLHVLCLSCLLLGIICQVQSLNTVCLSEKLYLQHRVVTDSIVFSSLVVIANVSLETNTKTTLFQKLYFWNTDLFLQNPFFPFNK